MDPRGRAAVPCSHLLGVGVRGCGARPSSAGTAAYRFGLPLALLKRAIQAERMMNRLKERHVRLADKLTAVHHPIAFPQRRA